MKSRDVLETAVLEKHAVAVLEQLRGAEMEFADATARDAWLAAQIAEWGGSFAAAVSHDKSRIRAFKTSCRLRSTGESFQLLADGTWGDVTALLKEAFEAFKTALAELLNTARVEAETIAASALEFGQVQISDEGDGLTFRDKYRQIGLRLAEAGMQAFIDKFTGYGLTVKDASGNTALETGPDGLRAALARALIGGAEVTAGEGFMVKDREGRIALDATGNGLSAALARAVIGGADVTAGEGFMVKDRAGNVALDATGDGLIAAMAKIVMGGATLTGGAGFTLKDREGNAALDVTPDGLAVALVKMVMGGATFTGGDNSTGLSIKDEAGNQALDLTAEGMALALVTLVLGDAVIRKSDDADVLLRLRDQAGYEKLKLTRSSGLALDADRLTVKGRAVDPREAMLDYVDLRCKAKRDGIFSRPIPERQLAVAKRNLIATYGQSFFAGKQSNPALSLTAKLGNLMMGDVALPQFNDGDTYTTFGTLAFNPAVAVTLNEDMEIVDPEDEDAIPPNSQAIGEVPVIAIVNELKRLHNRYFHTANDAARDFVGASAAIGGKTIIKLSPGNTEDGVDRFARFEGMLAAFVTLSGADTHVIPAWLFDQGQDDYTTASGSTCATEPTYYAALDNLTDAMDAACVAATGQALKPHGFIRQTGGEYSWDVDADDVMGLHVGTAQKRLTCGARGADGYGKLGVWLTGTSQQYPDKYGHPDANGARWSACNDAKVMALVMYKGVNFQPMRRLIQWIDGQYIYQGYLVPFGKGALGEIYQQLDDVLTPIDIDILGNAGGRCGDADGVTTIEEVVWVRDTIVRWKTARALDPATYYHFLGSKQGSNGNILLRDSDTTLASEVYEFFADRGMIPSANIAHLVNKPYPLFNFALAEFDQGDFSEL